jgi:NlpC/P60 family protein
MRFSISLLTVLFFASCHSADTSVQAISADSVIQADTIKTATNAIYTSNTEHIIPQPVTNSERCDLVDFAQTFVGTPYRYGSTDPSVGFDCSGFIYYVFNHFNITVPRSSVEYTNLGKEVSIESARPGDLILFTGTDSTIRVVGHMGIVTENIDTLKFVHSSSGKIFSVTITPLDKYYLSRFIKIINILPDDASSVAVDKTVVVNKVATVSTEKVISKTRVHKHHLHIRSVRKHLHSSKMHHLSKKRQVTKSKHSVVKHHRKHG